MLTIIAVAGLVLVIIISILDFIKALRQKKLRKIKVSTKKQAA